MDPIITSILLKVATWLIEKGLDASGRILANGPLDIAISATEEAFPELVVAPSLRLWAESGHLAEIATQVLTARQYVDDASIVQSFLDHSDFYNAEDPVGVAGPVIETFLQQLQEAVLRGDSGLVLLSAREDVQHELTRSVTREANAALAGELIPRIEALSAILDNPALRSADPSAPPATPEEERLAGRTDAARNLIEAGRCRAANEELERILIEAKQVGVSPSLMFRVLTNLGASLLEMDDVDGARSNFEAALEYTPDAPKGQTNLAFCLYLQGDISGALDLLAIASASPEVDLSQVATVRILAWGQQGAVDQVTDLWAQDWAREDPSVALAVGRVFLANDDLVAAIPVLRKAVDLSPDNPHALLALAQALFESGQQALRREETLPWKAGEGLVDELREAEVLLTSAIGRLESADNRASLLDALAGRSGLRALLDREEEAAADADRVLFDSPQHPVALKNRGILYLRAGDYYNAAIIMTRAVEASPQLVGDLALPLAHANQQLDRSDEVLSALEPLWQQEEPAVDQRELVGPLIWALRREGRLVDLALAVDQARERWPDDPSVLLALARDEAAEGNNEAAGSLVAEALAYMGDGGNDFRHLEAADVLFAIDRFSEAADLFAPIVDTGVNNRPLRKYVVALYNAGRYAEALQVAQGLRASGTAIATLSEIEAAILESSGDWDGADRLWAELTEQDGDNSGYKLNRVRLALRRGDSQSARSLLDEITDESVRDDPESLMAVAQSRHAVGDLAGVLEPAYRARRMAFDDPRMHMAYMGTVLGLEGVDALEPPDEVGVGTALLLRCGERERWLIVLDDDLVRRDRGELSPDDPLARKLLGLKVGDTVTLRETALEKEPPCEVVELQSKYVRALQDSIANFGEWFPEDASLQKVAVPDGDPSAVLEAVRLRHEHIQEVLRQYEAEGLPLGAVAAMSGSTLLDTFMGVAGSPNQALRASSGSASERETAAVGLAATTPMVAIELTALLTIFGLDMHERVLESLSVVTPQSLVEALSDQILSMRMAPVPMGTLAMVGEEYVRTEVDPEDYEKGIQRLEMLRESVVSRTTIVPANLAIDLPHGAYTRLAETLSAQAIDAVLVAAERDVPLYSDDLGLKRLGFQEWNIGGVWTQDVLRSMRDKDVLSNDDYLEAVVKLASSGFTFVSLSADDLVWGLRNDDFAVGSTLGAMLPLLEGPRVGEDSAVIVLADFTKQVWLERVLFESRLALLEAALSTLVTGRERRGVISKFRVALRSRFALLPTALETIDRVVDLWARREELGRGLIRLP